jgi:16S rRNA (cytosine1402-N4)-methyltransferase
MDRSQKMSAYDFINQAPEEELRQVIWKYGEEKMARRIARRIVQARALEPIRTTLSLANIITRACPPSANSRIHPATRTFQAIRIRVNNELDNLECAIEAGMESLRPGGRFCIISFHSLEDRIVKNTFRSWAKTCVCPPDLPLCVCNRQRKMNVLTTKPVFPKAEEIKANPRARSARLRIAERV